MVSIFRSFLDWLNSDIVADFQREARHHEPEATRAELDGQVASLNLSKTREDLLQRELMRLKGI